jgi:hypothetical protein
VYSSAPGNLNSNVEVTDESSRCWRCGGRRCRVGRRAGRAARRESSALFADRRNNQPGGVTFEELLTERNNVFRRYPKTQFIAAHFGWHANDLARAATAAPP